MRPVVDLAPGGAYDGPAGGGEALVATAVRLEGLTRAVGLAAVGLDGDASVGPGEVDPDRGVAVTRVDVVLGSGVGESEAAGEGEESFAEFVVGGGASDVVGLEDVAHGLGAGAGWVAGELVVEGAAVECLQAVGLVEGALQLAGGDQFTEVQEGAGDGGHGDVVDDGDVRGGERGGAMDEDALVPAPGAAGHGHLDLPVAVGAELVQAGGGAVGEDRARAAGEDGGGVEPLALEELAGHQGVDGLVDAMQAAGGDALADGALRQPELAQLVQAKRPVLRARELGQRPVNRGRLEKVAVSSTLSCSLGHGRKGSRERVTCLSRCVAIRLVSLA